MSEQIVMTNEMDDCDKEIDEEETGLEEDSAYSYGWALVPEPVLLSILRRLSHKDIVRASGCCQRWNDIAKDDFLWRQLFQRDFKVAVDIPLKPGAESWHSEYRRLTNNVPMVLTDDLNNAHGHQVLHVSFAHNGKMFATCSKDAFVIIWNTDYPCTKKYSHDMKQLSWKYTQYSQFNQSDTLLLVSGVHFGAPQSTSGEIAVISVTGDSHLRCRVINRPYDIFGTWFSDQHLISGELHWLAHLVSTSVLWMNKANQEVESEHVPIMNQMFKFYNRNASSIRGLLVADCPWVDQQGVDDSAMTEESKTVDASASTVGESSESRSTGNPLSGQLRQHEFNEDSIAESHLFGETKEPNPLSIQYSSEYRLEYENNSNEPLDTISDDDDAGDDDDDDTDPNGDSSDDDDLDMVGSKYLIFSTGSKTYSPHQIGIKLVQNVNFPKRLDPGPTLKERIVAQERKKLLQATVPTNDTDWLNFDSVSARFDKVDKLIDLHGHIVGMALSPDHRYLYVNSRSWPKDYVITNAHEPPPIAQEIDIHVIDLTTFKQVGNLLRSHKGYTPNSECFFLFLDVCDNYVASGAEDMHAYLWDRYYGVCLAKYQHSDVVNSVAFNSKDSQMLVTTSDDYTIKIWRSVQQVADLKATAIKRAIEFRRKN